MDFRLSRGPQTIGLCQGDIASVAQSVNAAQERLITDRGAGELGWFGSSARTIFNVSQTDPFITLPRYIARIEMADVCRNPIAIQNDWYQFLEFGNGLQTQQCCTSLANSRCQQLQMYRIGNFPTFRDIIPPNKTIRVFMTDASDVNKRVLIQGEDNQGQPILSQDGLTPTVGEFLTLASPFVQFPMELSKVTGIQKDVTNGVVKFYEVDLSTGAMVLILSMDPGETSAWYPRYQIGGLPKNCCNNAALPNTAQITCMAKLEFIPAVVDTDWLIIQSLEALIEEVQAVRYSGLDSGGADQKSAVHHHAAIGFLKGQLTHLLGQNMPAVVFAPFGSAKLSRRGIGRLI